MDNKLLEFQKKVGAITKDATNPFFKSKYFDINKLLEVVKPILNELGLVLIQPLSHVMGKPAIDTIILDDGKIIISSTTVLPENHDPQKMGSIITYYRRYSIQSLLGLQAEDDDGNLGSQKKETKPYSKIATPAVNKEVIARLLQDASPMLLSTTEDYVVACKDLTGLDLKPENYEKIINSLNN